MTYQGSKAKYSKYIVPIIQKVIDENNIDTFIDCCCGGCNIIKDIKAKNKIGIDKNENLIAFLQEISNGTFQIPETKPSIEIWNDCKYNSNSTVSPAMKGFVGIFCSYRAAGFYKSGYIHGEAGEKQYKGRCNTLKKEIHKYKDINFIAADLSEILKYNNCVIYVDPPYKSGYHEYDVDKNFNYERFWNIIREASKNNYVFVSEQEAPEDFSEIWTFEKDAKVFGNQTKIIEKLFTIKK